MNKKVSKKILEYTAIFEPAEEGGYIVSIPAIPGCYSEGDTFEKAVSNIKDAIKGCIEVLREEGHDIPEEKPDTVITKVSVKSPTAYL